MFWIVLTGLQFVAVAGLVKYIGTALPPVESAFLRYAFGLIFVIPAFRSVIEARLLRRDVMIFTLRGAAHGFGVVMWFYAMTQISIAEVTAMNYLTPVLTTVGAALFLRERLSGPRIAAIAVALLGALMILRPGVQAVSSGHLAMLGTASMFAFSYLVAKTMVDRASPVVIVAMLSIIVTVFLAPFAYAVWVPPTLDDLGTLFLVACFATGAHYTMTLAFQAAPLTVTQPLAFLQLIWASLLGMLVFGETPDVWVIAGGTVIFGSVCYITFRSAITRRHRRQSALRASGDNPRAS